MGAMYDFLPKLSPNSLEEKKLLFPRIVSRGTVSVDDIVEKIVIATSLTKADIVAVLATLEDEMAGYISNGYHFELGKIGYFWAKLSAPPVENKDEIHSQSVSFVNVNFRASSAFKRACRGNIERAKDGFRHSKEITLEQCKDKIKDYLKNHHSMSLSDFTAVTGLLKGKGKGMIDVLLEEGFIVSSGKSTHKVYHLA